MEQQSRDNARKIGYTGLMARDDYFSIVYKILQYLYDRLKAGEDPDPERLGACTEWYCINRKYWLYIMKHMIDGGYIEGAEYRTFIDGDDVIHLDKAAITPEGIKYLLDNRMIKKVVNAIKTMKDIVE